MADTKYMEKQVYDVSLGSDVYQVYTSLSGSGSLGGPESSVDGNIATWNGTDGELLQDSGVGVNDLAELTDGSETTLHSHATVLWNGHDELSDVAYTDVVVSASNVRIPTASRPSSVSWNGIGEVLSFAPGELIYIEGMQVPHGYVAGTDMNFHIHFTPDSNFTDGETIVWEFEWCSAAVFDLFPSTTTAKVTMTNNSTLRAKLDSSCLSGTTILPDSHLLLGGWTIDGTGLTLSNITMGRLEYDPDNESTYGGECILLSADAHIQVNRLGSELEYSDT